MPTEHFQSNLDCEHPVCLECIRQWRQNDRMDNSKSCPICRQVTHVVVPSTIWLADPTAKAEALELYKKKMGSIDCKYYAFGDGTCPFSISCLYRYVRQDVKGIDTEF
jgi:E3 ubiquitin-protein ligase makorin